MVAGSIVGMEISSALALGRSLLREHGLEHWRVTTDHAKTRAGVCRFGTLQPQPPEVPIGPEA
ncbi:hypothetical protein Q9R29_15710 [Rothia sp. ARF10]|nr:hypothetical protein [Rothia sp. ARF10]